jgi:TolB protein
VIAALVLPGLIGLLLLAPGARAQTDVRIDIKGAGNRMQLWLEPLKPDGDRQAANFALQADEVLANDLATSAVFRVARQGVDAPPADAQAVVHGSFRVDGSRLRLTGEVHDLPGRRQIFGKEYTSALSDWRVLVHAFADDVVQQFTGEPGVANTRIAFVVQNGREKELWSMDADGARLTQMTRDRSIAQSPSWAPDASLVLFTSYRAGGGPRIFVTPGIGGKVYQVSARPGINIAASYSPDGKEIAATLSHEGNPEVYVMDARGGSLRRLTNSRSIDTSPSWSPTGREIAFTSDRSGSPQVYVMNRDGSDVRRLTYDLGYTDSPAWSPKGDRIAFVSRAGGGFEIQTCRPDGTDLRLVVSGGSNENPRWSPDGRHLIFTSSRDGPFGLYVSDLDGTSPRKLDTGGRIALSPAWSPRLTPPGRTASHVDRSVQGGTK